VPLGAVVVIACVAQFMVVLDTSIVNVALPAMRAALGLSTTGQQWVVDGYLITFGGFLLLAARASDLLGRRAVFQAGLVVFTLASLAGGFAVSGPMLLAARIIQGAGAAALAPASLSLITASQAGHQRTRALTYWSVAASSAGAAGMVIGGVLTAELSWRWVLFVNVPLGIALLAAATACLLPAAPAAGRRRIDVPGALAVTLGAGVLVYGISQATTSGWSSAAVIAPLASAAVLIAAFTVIERRSAQPLIPLAIFGRRNLRTANLVAALLGVVMTSTIFFMSLYLQQVLGYSALRAGLALVPWTLFLMAGSFASRRLVAFRGPRVLLVCGALITAAALAWLSRLPDQPGYLAHILGPTIVAGIGMSLMVLPVTVAGTAGVEPRDAGLASGLLNTGRQVGGALGLAILVTVAASVTGHSGARSPSAAVVHGYQVALLTGAGISVLAAATALFLRGAPRPAPDASARPGPSAAAASSADA
jgi:EmrB/QacA subfamily drug resistance transporter